MKLLLIDFDETLIDSPSREFAKELFKEMPSSWYRNPISLSTEKFDLKINEEIVSLINDKDKDTFIVLLTGRVLPMKYHVMEVLKHHNILEKFDLIQCKDVVKKRKELFKKERLRNFLDNNHNIDFVELYEDNQNNADAIEQLLTERNITNKINCKKWF